MPWLRYLGENSGYLLNKGYVRPIGRVDEMEKRNVLSLSGMETQFQVVESMATSHDN